MSDDEKRLLVETKMGVLQFLLGVMREARNSATMGATASQVLQLAQAYVALDMARPGPEAALAQLKGLR